MAGKVTWYNLSPESGRSSAVECFLAKEEAVGANPIARSRALMLELVDRHASGACAFTSVGVQLPLRALHLITVYISA